MAVKIHESWRGRLESEFEKDYFLTLTEFVKEEYVGKKVYPDPSNIFNAFELCPFEDVKVVILGQDPYHGVGQAHGLSFSVKDGVAIPPSLQNIYKEIVADLQCPEKLSELMKSGNLERWSKQGVLLLNATLTVVAGQAGSHQGRGWEVFTDRVIDVLSSGREGLVFMLWGKYAQNKGQIIDEGKHLVLKAAHPSPFSAYNGFFGCKHFSKANEYLKSKNLSAIDWLKT
ncbi:uracil-DNA glycosylase [Candidatus Peregrinibacteria bacterium HGW-Peregrinibacteria-1]|jgi:uracil-DNA glycosylase|nr:MAG: uracil-DNA glycosylase [Candidatus Peregrinibacteria bacterium HGW-Peregrinibacteria-1]